MGKKRRQLVTPKTTVKRRSVMKRASLVKLCCLVLVCVGFAAWTLDALGQEKKAIEQYMPLLKGTQWQQIEPDAKVAFIWGVAHVVLIEKILMDEFPELKRESFVTRLPTPPRSAIGISMITTQPPRGEGGHSSSY